MYNIEEIKNVIICGNALEELKKIPSNSIDMCITSPPYFNLRDYDRKGQIGLEDTCEEYINNLISVFKEVYRVLKKDGSCWVNIADCYAKKNNENIKKHSLMCIPDRFKIKMLDIGWICRNEIIWHKPNAMPCSAKTRFNNDYEKLFFFTKDDLYYFNTQYEECKTKNNKNNLKKCFKKSKYKDIKQETQYRQGLNKNRGLKLIKTRPKLPEQQDFVDFIRSRTSIRQLTEKSDIKKTKIEHWFRRDIKGFSYPSIEDWNKIKNLIKDDSQEFIKMDENLTYIKYETDDINKNIEKGRIKRAVWSINTKPFKGTHFAPYPEELINTPINACCPKNGIVLDCFMGSGTTGVVAKKQNKNYIGIELNNDFVSMAKERIKCINYTI